MTKVLLPQTQQNKSSDKWAALAFLTPNLIGFLVFTSLPVLATILLSFAEWDPVAEPLSKIHFVGLSNYSLLLGFTHQAHGWIANDPDFWVFTGNTLFFMLAIPISMALALLLAIALNQKLRGIAIFRTAFYLPSVAAGVGTMILWVWLLNPQYGLINTFLGAISIHGPNWLQDYYWAKPGLMVMMICTSMGGTAMIIYLAALQDVPQALYEAARIDGAGAWEQFVTVTWPVLQPATFFIFTMAVIEGFQGGFDMAYVMTQGGPDGSTSTLSYYTWSQAFQYFHLRYAAAIAVVMFAMIAVITGIVWRFGGEAVKPG
jgi:multiple sugar transport system permease protein